MKSTGRCYCGELQYEISSEAVFRAQCHCRECQYFTGGHPRVAMAIALADFRYTAGSPSSFTRNDLESPVTREFCGICGVHVAARTPAQPNHVLVHPGTLDDPSIFGQPEIAIFTAERQEFHHVPDGIPNFDRIPGG